MDGIDWNTLTASESGLRTPKELLILSELPEFQTVVGDSVRPKRILVEVKKVLSWKAKRVTETAPDIAKFAAPPQKTRESKEAEEEKVPRETNEAQSVAHDRNEPGHFANTENGVSQRVASAEERPREHLTLGTAGKERERVTLVAPVKGEFCGRGTDVTAKTRVSTVKAADTALDLRHVTWSIR